VGGERQPLPGIRAGGEAAGEVQGVQGAEYGGKRLGGAGENRVGERDAMDRPPQGLDRV
jgi:hypothetical protein